MVSPPHESNHELDRRNVRRPTRRPWQAGFLVLIFLTVQLATAAYACAGSRFAIGPAMDMGAMGDVADMSAMAAMVETAGMTESCPEMAKHAPEADGLHDGLCLEHCQAGAKAADHVSPQIPTFLPVLVGQTEPTPIATPVPLALAQSDAIARAPPPPIPVLHCCFRN